MSSRIGWSWPATSDDGEMAPRDDLKALLAEQQAYYRALAPDYAETGIPELPRAKLAQVHEDSLKALADFNPSGEVLELACGPGTWTGELLRTARSVTALDGSPEMLTLARARHSDDRVRFLQADLFDWEPDRCYDVVFFSFWLSHVPLEHFEAFWSKIGRALKPDGRVAFVDDGFRTPDELPDGEASQVIRRRLIDGRTFQAIKVPHRPEDLERRLRDLGWEMTVRGFGGPFFWGEGRPTP